MILICAIVPALILCLAILYAVLIQRFFTVKAKLPVLGVGGGAEPHGGQTEKAGGVGGAVFHSLSGGAVGLRFLDARYADGIQL